jgi:Mg/Co/Ni transporter MgtE
MRKEIELQLEKGIESTDSTTSLIPHISTTSQFSEKEFLIFLLSQPNQEELIHQRLANITRNSKHHEKNYAEKCSDMSLLEIAQSRIPAILITLVLGSFVGLEISLFHTLLQKNIVLTSLLPILVSIAGNIGLQSSSCTGRALTIGPRLDKCKISELVLKEISSSFIIGCFSGAIMFVMVMVWTLSFEMACITAASIWTISVLSGAIGASGPVIYVHLGLDPALMAGPFETAALDLIGTLIYLGLASLLL